jgi:iron complex outermembrane receptor protein
VSSLISRACRVGCWFSLLPLLAVPSLAWAAQAEPPPPPPPAEPPPPPPAPPAASEPPPPPTPAEEEEVVGGPAQRATTPGDTVRAGQKPMEEEIVVTGSRIRRKDLNGPAPVIVYSREQIQATGRVNVGEFLQTIPEQSNAIGRGTNNGGDGAIRINLRGIGTQGTLVLLNGHRIVPGGTGADSSVDFSAIPTNVIERIEILKDGASAIYGSDAIAGVVNIITRKRMQGGELSALGGTTSRLDGNTVDVSAMVGTTSDKGSLLFSMGYYNSGAIMAKDRKFSQEQKVLDSTNGQVTSLGSGTTPNSRIVLPANQAGVQNGNAAWNSLVAANPMATSFIRDPVTGMFRPFTGAGINQDGYNFQPVNYLVTPQERFHVFSSGEYRLGSSARLYFDSFYSKRNSGQILAPEPLNLDQEGVVVSAMNIYNPFGRDFDGIRRRLVEFGGRRTHQDINNFHLVAGVDGTIPASWGPLKGWFWDFAFNFGRNESTEVKQGNVRLTKLADAVGPSFLDATGKPRCGTMAAPIEGCLPLNLFGAPNSPATSINDDQVKALTFTGVQRGDNQLIGGQFNASGDLFHITDEQAVALALGYEFRSVKGGQIPDPITVAGETSGNKGLITQGSYFANELYGELSIPIVENRFLAEKVELIAAGRASFYKLFGSTFNYKFGGRWSPWEDFSLRATYSTGFRAPSISDLFQGQQDNFANVADPCGVKVVPNSPRAANCGAATNNGDDQSQLRSRVGGNDKLTPEKSRSVTAGLVLHPQAAKGFYFTADYYNIKITNRISSFGASVILQGCYPDASGAVPKYCNLIHRDLNTQRIDHIDDLNANVGQDILDGVDFTGGYDLSTSLGHWGVQVVTSYLHRYDRTLADGSVIKGAGTWDLSSSGNGGTGGAYPHFRMNANIGWSLNGFVAGLRTYFIGSYKECGDADGQLAGSGLCYDPNHKGERAVSAYNTWDLTLGYGIKTSAGLTSLSIGVINLFDQSPPIVYNGFADTTDTYSYDLAMQQFYARLTHQF